jgi:hypothetical protein
MTGILLVQLEAHAAACTSGAANASGGDAARWKVLFAVLTVPAAARAITLFAMSRKTPA